MSWRSRSYSVLPALSIRRRALRGALRTVTVAWMFGMVWASLASGAHVKVFCRMIGFNDFAFGVMGAIPFLATFGQLFASVLIERSGLRKYQFLHTAVIHRLSWLLLAVIPLILPLPSTWAVVWMLAVLSMSWFMAALSAPAWLTWMGDLIPRRIRGRFLASRERRALAVQAIVVTVAGLLLDAVYNRALPETPDAQGSALTLISLIFVVAAVFGAVDIFLFIRVREVLPAQPPKSVLDFSEPRPRLWRLGRLAHWSGRYARALGRQVLLEPLRDRVFRRYVFYGAMLMFSATVGNWYFWLHAMEGLGFSKLGANFLFMVVGPVSGVVTARFWGRLIDRYGRRPVLMLATMGAVCSVIPWLFTYREMPLPGFVTWTINALAGLAGRLTGHEGWVWIDPAAPVGSYLVAGTGCVIGGSSWLGIGLAQTGIMLAFSDSGGRSRFVAACAVLINVGGVLGGLVGGMIAQWLIFLQDSPLEWGPLRFTNWHATFIAAILARFIAVFWLRGMPEPGSAPVLNVLRQVGANVYSNAATLLLYPLRVVGWRPSYARRTRPHSPGSQSPAGDGEREENGE